MSDDDIALQEMYESLGVSYHPSLCCSSTSKSDKISSVKAFIAIEERPKIVKLDNELYSSSKIMKNEELQSSLIQQYRESYGANAANDTAEEIASCEELMASMMQGEQDKIADDEEYFCGNCEVVAFEEVGIEEPGQEEQEEQEDDEEEDIPTNPRSLSQKKKKGSDMDLKQFAVGNRLFISPCNPAECKFGGGCVGSTTIDDMQNMVVSFWGKLDAQAPSTTTRRMLILEILRKSIDYNTNEFNFYAGCKKVDNTRVCEAGFLNLLGLMNSPNASKAPSQWINIKKHVASGADRDGIPYKFKKSGNDKSDGESSVKFNHAASFIEYFAKNFGDTIPDAHGKYPIV